jgi:hypothetical protein
VALSFDTSAQHTICVVPQCPQPISPSKPSTGRRVGVVLSRRFSGELKKCLRSQSNRDFRVKFRSGWGSSAPAVAWLTSTNILCRPDLSRRGALHCFMAATGAKKCHMQHTGTKWLCESGLTKLRECRVFGNWKRGLLLLRDKLVSLKSSAA